jgi:hypothetical protein
MQSAGSTGTCELLHTANNKKVFDDHSDSNPDINVTKSSYFTNPA